MSTVNKTNSSEIEGSQVAIILCDETGAEPARSILALSTKGDLSTAFDEDSEDFTPGAERQTRQYRTSQTFTVEVSSALAADLEAMTEIGLASDSGTDGIEFSTSTDDRRIGFGEEKYVEVAYLADELPSDLSTFDVADDTEAFSDRVTEIAADADVEMSTSIAAGFSTEVKTLHPGSVVLDTAEQLAADFIVVPREPATDAESDVLEKAAEYVLLYASQPVLSV
jgi:nucleotide-binding universal stress UspA family protein